MDSHVEPTAVVSVYLTFPDEIVARMVARALVERRLVACVNVLGAGTSVYRWQGEVVTEHEVFALAKTTSARLASMRAAVEELHPYDLPCVVAYAVDDGSSSAYLEWVRQEVA